MEELICLLSLYFTGSILIMLTTVFVILVLSDIYFKFRKKYRTWKLDRRWNRIYKTEFSYRGK